MKISDVIDELKNSIEISGDLYVRSFEIETEEEVFGRKMLSNTRKTKSGQRAKMTWEEFMEYVRRSKE